MNNDHGDEDHDHDEDGGDCVNAMIEFDEWQDEIVDCNYTSDNQDGNVDEDEKMMIIMIWWYRLT